VSAKLCVHDQRSGHTVNIRYEGHPTPAMNAVCKIGNLSPRPVGGYTIAVAATWVPLPKVSWHAVGKVFGHKTDTRRKI